MNFDLTEEQQLLADSIRRFIANDYAFEARQKIVASADGYSAEVWNTMAEMGLLALPLPAEYDGFGGGAGDLMTVMDAIGEALVVEYRQQEPGVVVIDLGVADVHVSGGSTCCGGCT